MTLQGENIHVREKRTEKILEFLANGTRAPILIHNNSDVISCNDAHALHIIDHKINYMLIPIKLHEFLENLT